MKYIIISIALILSINVFTQNEVYTNTFVRIYNLNGKKINKGKVKSISETSIELYLKGESIKIPLSQIGKIKTKRSVGNNVGKGALIGGGSLAVLGLLSGDDNDGLISFSATDKAIIGLIGGGIMGTIVGGITAIFKKPTLYIIEGNEIKWKDFKEKN
ncbi:hypothetical protein [Algibacter sp.]|uniref:hypothetical protein n=1 Tax=Algibacter sp. TaxID=1872428 RepID=UPI003C78EF8E